MCWGLCQLHALPVPGETGKAIPRRAPPTPAKSLPVPRRSHAYPNPAADGSLKTLKGEVDKVIGEFAQRGIKPADLEKGHQQPSRVRHLGTRQHRGKVSQRHGAGAGQDPDYVFKNLDAIARVRV